MDFQYSEEQQLLRESVNKYGANTWPAANRHKYLNEGTAWRKSRWAELAEMGWLMLPIPEAQGGLDGQPADVMVVAECIGRHLITSPYITSCVLVPALLAESGLAGYEILGAIGMGEVIAAAGLIEPDAGYDFQSVSLTAEKSGSGFALTGSKIHVEDGGDADWFIVSARTAEATPEADGISLFLVPRNASGLEVGCYRSIDHHRHAKLKLSGVTDAVLVSPLGAALPVIERAVDQAICAHLAEAIGSMDAVTKATLDYVKTRKQFDATLGSFQVVQHRLVDMTLAGEEARSIMYQATLSLSHPRLERRRIVSAAKARVCQSGLYVGRDAVQLHGGVGISEELVVSHHLRRQMMLEFAHGSSDLHVGKYVAANTALLKLS